MLYTASRTKKVFTNVKVALLFYSVNLLLQFVSRKVFIDKLGTEILGLNTTANNLLGFLNIAELGVGAAVAVNLYKPIYENDTKAINAIVSLQGWMYRRVAFVVIVGAVIMMCFFPLIFEKADVPMWYTYGSFGVLLLSSLLGYFVNYRQIVLTADQKEYKITMVTQGVRVLKVLFQVLAIFFLPYGYVWWMGLEALFSFVTAYFLDRTIRREYPWLKTEVKNGSELRKQYPAVITKTKQVFFHKIGGFALTQTTPLIIYGYASLTLVAIYGYYLLITYGLKYLVEAMLNGMTASVGNLVTEGNKSRIKAVYWELTIGRMWIAAVLCCAFYVLVDSFISLWVGADYVLDDSALAMLTINTFLYLSRTNDAFINAYGLFQDIWAPIAEATINIGLSILLGHFWGLTGILIGVFVSQLSIVYIWKPIFLYWKGFKDNFSEYFLRYLKYLCILIISFIVSKAFFDMIAFNNITVKSFIVNAIVFIVMYGSLSTLILFLLDRYFKSVCIRILRTVLSR